jgi:pyruvate dehydrogenase E1 component alpha subunit
VENQVYDGKIEYIQIIDENGNADPALFPKDLSDEKIVEMYKMMLFARALDAKAMSLQRQGRAVTYAPLLGEEATQIGSAMAMGEKDIFVPSFRQHGVFLARKVPLELMFIGWRGFEDGAKVPKSVNGTPVIVPVSTQVPHAAGIAFAQRYRNTGAAVVAYVGDGGTSEGDFYEALNFAGVWKLPFVLIIENNQWAISVPRSKQTAAGTLAQKAMAAGIGAVQVDGNDVVAVYQATKEAIAAKLPFVIECVTYRMSLHTTADDPTKYRNDAEVEAWKPKDPISRIRAYLTRKGLWNEDKEAQAAEEQAKEIDLAVEKAEQFKPDPRSIFEHIYSYMPDVLGEELDEAETAGWWQGGD